VSRSVPRSSHDFHGRRFDDLGPSTMYSYSRCGVCSRTTSPGWEPIQVPEELAVDVIVRRQHHVSILARICRANVLGHRLL